MAYLMDYKNGNIVKKKNQKWEHEMKRKKYNFSDNIIVYTVDASKYTNI